MSEDFLSRWSRRKRQARIEEPQPPHPGAHESEGPSADAPQEAAPEEDVTTVSEAALSEEDIARLPSLEELTADTDITVFLRKGVPERLRNAALRRMWSLDPNIRDYVSEAREYAYDWNVPGGVPGFGGALPPPEEVARLAARIVGAITAEPDANPAHGLPPGAEAAVSQKRESTSSEEAPSVDERVQPPSHEYPETGLKLPEPRGETVQAEPFTAKQRQADAAAEPLAPRQAAPDDGLKALPRRRHGSAKPL